MARALLAEPDWLFLDESTAALDEKSEANLYRVIAATLPETTIVSIGHRSTLNAFHKRRIAFETHAGRPGDDRRGAGAGGVSGASAQSERASRIVPRGPLITRSPLTRSHSGLPRSPDRKPISNALMSLLGHSFLVSA